jgi:preprotein translocase subunit SecE
MNVFLKPINFLREVKLELSKVSWSTREELIGATIVVILVTALLAIYIGSVDALLSKALSLVFR